MAENANMECLASFMECSICLDKFDNPKLLSCGHQFCKQCLEDIVEFREDGVGVILCPYRCDVQTNIGIDQTVNNLQTTYVLRGMLDALKTVEDRLDAQVPKCAYIENCAKQVSTYCCERLMCKSCFTNHMETGAEGEHKKKVNISFNKRENKLRVLCEEHFSGCTHLCIDNKFLCAYCLYRDKEHKKHSKNTVEADVKLLREALTNESYKNEDILHFLKITEESILRSKTKFADLLQQRKEECLSHYTDLLNKEEEMLKSEFQKICDDHIKQYSSHLTSSYYQDKLEKFDVQLALEKETILDAICKNKTVSLNCETVSISDMFDFRSDHPLGDLEVTVCGDVSVKSQPISTLNDGIKSGLTKNNVMQVPTAVDDIKPKFMQHSSCSKNLNVDSRSFDKSKRFNSSPHVKEVVEVDNVVCGMKNSFEVDETVEVVFKWLIDRVIPVPSIFLIVSNMMHNIELKKGVGCFKSGLVTIATGRYSGRLIIDTGTVPINDFVVKLSSEVVHLIVNRGIIIENKDED